MKLPKINWTFRKRFAAFMVLLIFVLIAASPSFQNFNTDQFGIVANTSIAIKTDGQFTNAHFFGSANTFPVGMRFDTVIVTNALAITDAAGVNNYQQNDIAGVWSLTGPGGIAATWDGGGANTWVFSVPVFGNGYGLTNLLTLSSNTTLVTTNARTIRFWGVANITNNNGVVDVVVPSTINSGSVVYPTNTPFAGPTNSLTLNNNYGLYTASGNISITNTTGSLGDRSMWTTLFITNASASSITNTITVGRFQGGSSTNSLIIGSGKVGIVSITSYGLMFTNVVTSTQQ